MKRPQKGSTVKQYAYAVRRMNPTTESSKKEMALLSGYTPSVAENIKAKVEDTEGYHNAIGVLAAESNNMLLAVLSEFKARGLTGFSNADLTKALNAITGAWAKIDEKRAPNKLKTPEGNPLRAIFTQRVETRTAVVEEVPSEETANAEEPIQAEAIDLDF